LEVYSIVASIGLHSFLQNTITVLCRTNQRA